MVSCEKKDTRQFCYSEGLEFKRGGEVAANERFGIFLKTFFRKKTKTGYLNLKRMHQSPAQQVHFQIKTHFILLAV